MLVILNITGMVSSQRLNYFIVTDFLHSSHSFFRISRYVNNNVYTFKQRCQLSDGAFSQRSLLTSRVVQSRFQKRIVQTTASCGRIVAPRVVVVVVVVVVLMMMMILCV